MLPLTHSQELLYCLIKGLGVSDDKVKLAKLAYFADFIHYAFHDRPISEETNVYQKRNFGPLSISFNADLRALKEEGLIESLQKFHFNPTKKKVEVKLDKDQLYTIKYVLDKYKDYSFNTLAELSHKQTPYLTATEGGVIDYNTAYNLVEEYSDYTSS